MAKLYDLARMTTATTGTGTITLGSAVNPYLTFANAGVQDQDVVTYAIQDVNNSEIGRGTYTASGTTLSRTVLKSTNSNAAINLSGTAQVFITLAAEDLSTFVSPTVSVTTPLLIGGSATSSALVIESTSGAGATDYIAFQTGSQSERMRILSGGNVGIGNTNPGAMLDINTGTSSDQLRIGHSATLYKIGRNTANGNLDFNGTQAGVIGYTFSGGNVGIGTTSPSQALTVLSTGAMAFDNGSGTADLMWTRAAAATFQFGPADAAAPTAQLEQINSVVAGTTNTAGVDWTRRGSRGTGTGAGGKQIFQTAPAGSTGSSQNAFATGLTITAPVVNMQPSVVIGNQALATTATDGFLYIPTCAGTPTGVPTTQTGRIAMVYDTTNHQFWFYDSSWKQPKTPAGAALVTWQ